MVSYLFICKRACFAEFRDIFFVQICGVLPPQKKKKLKFLGLVVHLKVATRRKLFTQNWLPGRKCCTEKLLPEKNCALKTGNRKNCCIVFL